MFRLVPLLSLWMVVATTSSGIAWGQNSDLNESQRLEFFESRIRPVLIAHCYECHNSTDTAEGGLALDSRDGLREGGDSGQVVFPRDPTKSRLLATLRHEIPGLEMPEGGAKLDDAVIADFEHWIASGAIDPRDAPPDADELTAATSWEAKLLRRKQWWSFQPIRESQPPNVASSDKKATPIDRFILAKLQASGLPSADAAPPATLVRRLYFNLIGLPPTPTESHDWISRIEAVERGQRDDVLGELVNELIDSPHFGERWARHWMDWIRYAESHGSEGDPEIVGAWRYRDYLIRAFNEDVPLDQLIREHVAGDLLTSPRTNEELGINESVIGPAHWRMVFHGFAPTDALDEKVRFIDDQINAFSKAFLGVTVSCARCHDHKFDAISQADYYALFGVLGSCRPGRNTIDLPEQLEKNREQLSSLKVGIRSAVARDWLEDVEGLRERIDTGTPTEKSIKGELPSFLKQLRDADDWERLFEEQLNQYSLRFDNDEESSSVSHHTRFNQRDSLPGWYRHGAGLRDSPCAAGEFSIHCQDENLALVGIYPAGAYSHLISSKHGARLSSSDLRVDEEMELWVHAIGKQGATLRYAVQDYPRNGTVYPVKALTDQWTWHRFDLGYWRGDQVHVELATAADAPLLAKDQARSWFGIREVRLQRKGKAAPNRLATETLSPLWRAAQADRPETIDELLDLLVGAIATAIERWEDGRITDGEALLLDACLREGLLANRTSDLQMARPLIKQYRELENEIAIARRVPGLDETVGTDQPLFIRGDHHRPADPVPRRFLEAIDKTPYQTNQSGRLELAEDLLRDDNPLTRRVLANRVWHHLFGQGIVSTPDNFGELGDRPSHPELLDWLALQLERDDWSLKSLIRRIVTSRTWQLDSKPSRQAQGVDPENRLLSHSNIRRMEAEAIRDQLVFVSGRLAPTIGGEPVPGSSPRRSIYVRVRRNSLDPFLRVFDFPEPFSAVGRRDVTNVPAQSLAVLNDPQIASYARGWTQGILNRTGVQTQVGSRVDRGGSRQDFRPTMDDGEGVARDRARVVNMFEEALSRTPTEDEVTRCLSFVRDFKRRMDHRLQQADRLRQQIATRQASIEALKAPLRVRLLAERQGQNQSLSQVVPQAIASWDFAKSVRDQIGSAHGQLRGGAKLENGALIVRHGGHMVTAPLEQDVHAKTLEAWVQLDELHQRGGGVMTIQSPDGQVFDSIVIGEKQPGHWLAGSDHHHRTESFAGEEETDAAGRWVHLAVVYETDGRITGYRDGRRYGQTYQATKTVRFQAGQAMVSFGVRHLPAVGNRMLSGRIARSRLYDRALTAEQVAASANGQADFVSEEELIAAFTDQQRSEWEALKQDVAELQARLKAYPAPAQRNDELTVWSELARAIFTFKEFIYVR